MQMKRSTQAQQSAHTILMNPKRERDEPDNKRSQTENVETCKKLVARISDVNKMLCEKPSIDLTHDALARPRKVPVEELKKGRSRELDNSMRFDAFDEVHELPPEQKTYDMVRVDEWRGDKVRSLVCVRQFEAEQSRDDTFE